MCKALSFVYIEDDYGSKVKVPVIPCPKCGVPVVLEEENENWCANCNTDLDGHGNILTRKLDL